MEKRILGLDLGTNSIGWALIKHSFDEKKGEILGMGSRIIPMDAAKVGEFERGNPVSATADRTKFRSVRRLYERDVLRRERLHRVLHILDFLPTHYAENIDFENRPGQFMKNKEPKLPYQEISNKKYDFIFKDSFQEMVDDFRITQPQLFYLKANGSESKIPYDWTIYYLRKKALSEKINKEELAWILLNFNQKRGYYQLRGEDEELEDNKEITFEILKVDKVIDSGEKIKNSGAILYDVYFENGWKYDKRVTKTEDWAGKTKEFIVTTSVLASGEISRSYKAVNSEEDWIAIKQKTEQDIESTNKTVGEYIYDTLLKNPSQKIRGRLIRTIERKFYKKELKLILEKQKEFHPELRNRDLYKSSIEELYTNNEAHRNNIANRDFTYLFLDDIIFYQRPLKSKKSLVSNCPFEFRYFKKEDGTVEKTGVKCIAKSHPLYQEFRLLQWLKNLRIFSKEDINEVDITNELLPTTTDREKLFEWLNDKTEIDQKSFLKYVPFNLEERIKMRLGERQFQLFKKDKEQGLDTYYRWNYVEDKKYPLNETRGEILKRLKKTGIDVNVLDKDTETHLWHILYSVEDKAEIESALNSFAKKHNLPEGFVNEFKKYPRLDKEYGSYSAKAIKKVLPLMRFGKWWDGEAIDEFTRQKIDKILTGEYDEKIKNRVREKAVDLKEEQDFQNLPLWLVSYIVYNRHSETSDVQYWKTAQDIELLKQHSLRNPIVEQIINETLQTVREIWEYYGEGKEKFFDEIHVELGRSLKEPAEKRKKVSERITENENTNIRIKSLLVELFNDDEIENVRPYSPMQQEILKIYEEGVYQNPDVTYSMVSESEINKIRKKNQPSSSDIKKYKLWLEQGYRSPYTGVIIPLSKLFTPAYEIEHIIPKAKFFDDSLSNKIICESEVNSLKDNQLAYSFIKNNRELKIELSHGRFVNLLSPEAYEANVKRYFGNNRSKLRKLLLEEIPEDFTERQLNDTRYISKVVKTLLSNIVREEDEEEAIAKNVVASTGGVTALLKQDWGLNDVWNSLITPRFERLNRMAGCEKYGSWENKNGKVVFQINTIEPDLLKLNRKRIDHRHHALDALVVACSSRNHINYINNDNANGKDKSKPRRFDLRNQLRIIEEEEVNTVVNGELQRKRIKVAKEFLKPWESFTQDAKEELNRIVVTFKKNNRVINKTVNYYQKWVKQPDGTMKKAYVEQTKGDHWAIRKPLHKETVSALVNLQMKKTVNLSVALDNSKDIVNKLLRKKIDELISEGFEKKQIQKYFKGLDNRWAGEDISKVDVYNFTNDKESTMIAASRVKLDESFSEKNIESITDTGIRKILLAHLEKYKGLLDENGNPVAPETLAFSPTGIEELNKNILNLNGGKKHAPIYKVRKFEKFGEKFNVGVSGNKKQKFVEAAKGTNLFFAVYIDEDGKRNYETTPLNEVVEHQKWRATLTRQEKDITPIIPVNREKGKFLFSLSPNDLVYIPSVEELANPGEVDFNNLDKNQVKRIYKFVSCTGNQAFFIQSHVASNIVNNFEFSALNKMEKSIEDIMIKSVCWKLETDRLGNIIKIVGEGINRMSFPDRNILEESIAYSYSNELQAFIDQNEVNEIDAEKISKLSPKEII